MFFSDCCGFLPTITSPAAAGLLCAAILAFALPMAIPTPVLSRIVIIASAQRFCYLAVVCA